MPRPRRAPFALLVALGVAGGGGCRGPGLAGDDGDTGLAGVADGWNAPRAHLPDPLDEGWSVSVDAEARELRAGFGAGDDRPQFLALHLDSSYLRLVPARDSSWGASAVLLPSFWSGGAYMLGDAIEVRPSITGDELWLAFSGVQSTPAGERLTTTGLVRVSAPEGGEIRARVEGAASGEVTLDAREGEAFKPTALSTMHVADDLWDCEEAYVVTEDGAQAAYPIPPADGWLIPPVARGLSYGCRGGTSDWQANTPTVELAFGDPVDIAAWATQEQVGPSDENLLLWNATEGVLEAWGYTISAREAAGQR